MGVPKMEPVQLELQSCKTQEGLMRAEQEVNLSQEQPESYNKVFLHSFGMEGGRNVVWSFSSGS